ncbi:hypothetical protein SAMN04487818_105264 [Actinokineospora terrae]|uniref:Helix-turn-helix domain-containing protein n=2 Tax=Actinokineospora terrae TaxID=155974 RepID=A0A1H9S6K3_9PSEU|nr:hypothetical protein SAMN04487818_105264 [Actinokineospora terrae]
MKACETCRRPMASDNSGRLCTPCARRSVQASPAEEKPDEFWRRPALREALRSKHIGYVINAYRLEHRPVLTQAAVGRWLGLGQPQVSRLESSRTPVHDLNKLEAWARALHIPQPHLWFQLGKVSAQVGADSDTPWDELVRGLNRSDVGPRTVEQLQIFTEELCCEYAWRDAGELKAEARRCLQGISTLLSGSCTLVEHRELLVTAGWLMLLTGCIEYDMGNYRQAELDRSAAFRVGEETGHGEIIAWAFEMSAWFALTQGRLNAVGPACEAGTAAAPNSSVAVQLSAQAAKAAARMGQRDSVTKILDQGYRLLGQHERPTRPDNHFVIDPTKWDFYAMDCYRIVGEDRRAAEHAQEVLRISRRPDGSDRSPMRATEARLTLAVVALRQGDVAEAAEWTTTALAAERKSFDSLAMVADELRAEAERLFPNDPVAKAVTEPIKQAYALMRA